MSNFVKVKTLGELMQHRLDTTTIRTPGDRADPGSDRGVVPLTTPQSTAR